MEFLIIFGKFATKNRAMRKTSFYNNFAVSGSRPKIFPIPHCYAHNPQNEMSLFSYTCRDQDIDLEVLDTPAHNNQIGIMNFLMKLSSDFKCGFFPLRKFLTYYNQHIGSPYPPGFVCILHFLKANFSLNCRFLSRCQVECIRR